MTLKLEEDGPRVNLSKTGTGPPYERPLIRTISANGEAPSVIFQKCQWAKNCFLLDGSMGGWFDGQYSLLGGSPFGLFQSKGDTARFDYFHDHKIQTFKTEGNPIAELQFWLNRFQESEAFNNTENKIPFLSGGAIGFFSYDLARRFENIPNPLENDCDTPDIALLFINHFIVVDSSNNAIHIIYNPNADIRMGVDADRAIRYGYRKIDSMENTLKKSSRNTLYRKSNPPIEMKSNCSRDEYIQMVHRAKQYITNGDIFQANLSHRFSAPSRSSSLFGLYRDFSQVNPSPFSSYLDVVGIQIASGSPERLVRVKKFPDYTQVETRPIAGTKPRGKNDSEDESLVHSLCGSEKERAEHLMLIDLERNDLGKICRYGTVSVNAMMAVEQYSHVSHLVSNISGELRPNISALEILKAVFPGGTITGAPKIRCMEIIAELEKQARGIYTGSIGYIGFDGEIDLNIAIRTCVHLKNKLFFQVGAGIVADSNPALEYEETLHKAAAFMEALRFSENRSS